MAQRKFIKQLPVIQQTTTLQKFFNATIDQVFQPGELQNVNAFIGRKPSYFNANTDFYKPEYDAERSFYQLEPTMVSLDSTGTAQDLLFYSDIVNNLRYQGALVNDHERLFKTEYYSWCPPINLDKLDNYRNYYWMPDGPPIVTLTIPVNTYTGDGTTVAFAAPESLPDSIVNVKVKITGDYTTDFTYANGIVTLTTAPETGARVQVWTNGAFEANIDGKTAYTYPAPVITYAIEQKTISVGVGVDSQYDNDTQPSDDTQWSASPALATQVSQYEFPSIVLDPAPALMRGMLVEVIDDTWENDWDIMSFGDDLWDTKSALEVDIQKQNNELEIELVTRDVNLVQRSAPQFWTIERNSEVENPWSLNNCWYHADLMVYSGNGYNPTRAIRPIIEYFNSLKLFNYGATRKDAVDLVFDAQSFTVTDAIAGKRILVINTVNQIADGIYYVDSSTDTLALVPDTTPAIYDIVANGSNEYWFNGSAWVTAQAYSNGYPLFDLYDANGVSAADPSIYPSNTFAGSRVFSYSEDTTSLNPTDTVLNISPVFNSFGSFEFDNNINLDVTEINGLKYYATTTTTDSGVEFNYESNWHYAGETTQPIDTASGFYTIPQNLQANPDNDGISTISRNDWFPQFQQIEAQNDWLLDSKYFVLNGGTNIVQNRGTMLKTMLLSSDKNIDLMKSILYVEREYSRYRAKMAQYLTTLYTSGQIIDAASALTTALNYLKITKTSSFAFFNNGMGGDNYYIPASGAYLGLTPLWIPELIIQNSSAGGCAVMLRGHDGSLLPGFSKYTTQNVTLTAQGVMVDGEEEELDIRDTVLLAYEQQLYAACDSSLQTQRRPQFDLKTVQPGKFRTTDYSVAEYLQVAGPSFERWVAPKQLDFRTNKTFDPANVWTWNLSQLTDADGQAIPGYWRGLFRYYFDTDRPDTHPWEMLGWTSKPTWWDSAYSWTDATKRSALIAAIVAGQVDLNGTIDATFARPTFAKFIPVDSTGTLLDPITAGIVVDTSNATTFAEDWVFGDGAPVENAWLNSEYTSFSMAEISYLLKPVAFVETGWEPLDNELTYPGQANQWVSKVLGRRKHFTDYVIHNELVNKVATRVVGLQQWISDFVKSNGQDIAINFGNHVRGLGVQLAHKVGGFTDSKTMQASTESQGVLPSEDVKIALYNSPSVREEFYGGVIVKWNGAGWAVLGYDVLDPVFNILPMNTSGPSVTISLGDLEPSVRPWMPNTYYQTNVKVEWQNAVYACLKSHTSVSVFEPEYWNLQANVATGVSPSLKFFLKTSSTTAQRVPYGTVFNTMQEVATFLAGYEQYLISRGWVFDGFNTDLNEAIDFRLSTRQFLNWAQVSWAPGLFISLSPLSDGVKFSTDHGAIQSVEQMVNGVYSILDRGGKYVDIKNTLVNRINGELSVLTKNGDGIFGLRICVSEIEHCVLFNNTTIFNDVIYQPLFNLRQNRIRMNFNVSLDWNGTLNAPGFVLTDNLMVPSFDRSAEDVRNMYSIEQPVYSVMRDYARHQIGYQSRSYLADIFNNELNQFEFYQGMIQQKGSAGALNKLLRNTVLTQTTNLEFLEEWAFRDGLYGGVAQDNVVEFEITSDDIKQEPQQINFASGSEGLTADQLTALQNVDAIPVTLYSNSTAYDTRWVYPPKSNSVFKEEKNYLKRKGDLPTAGYVRTDEVAFAANSIADFSTMVQSGAANLVVGDRVWIYNNGSSTFDVLRTDTAISASDPAFQGLKDPVYGSDGVTVTGYKYTTLENCITAFNGSEITLLYPTSLQVGEYLYIASPSNTNPDVSGIYTVTAIASDNVTITVVETLAVSNTFDSTSDYTDPFVTGATIAEAGADAPTVRRLYSVRFNEQRGASFDAFGNISLDYSKVTVPTTGWATGELLYVDVGYEVAFQTQYNGSWKRWNVLQWTGSTFVTYRTQAPRIDRSLIASAKLYDTTTSISSSSDQLQANPLLLPDVMPYDPVQGLIPGAALREVFYMQEYDPARYNQGSDQAPGINWDKSQIGRVWWNLDSTRFMLAETNDLTSLNATDITTELAYRVKNWGAVAPGSEVDLYEWTESDINPKDWTTTFAAGATDTIDGPVFNSVDPSWVEKQVYDSTTGTFVTKFYFWVKNRQTTPAVDFRNISSAAAAAIITDPAAQGIAWMAPVSASTMIVKEVSQYLTPTSSLQMRISKNKAKVGKHSEWALLREGDPISLPSDGLFTNMVTSLAGFNALNNPIPNPSLYVTTRTGNDLRIGQSWFTNLSKARKHLTQYLNNVFGAMLLADERPYALAAMQMVDDDSQYMQWTQSIGSTYQKPVPSSYFWNQKYGSLQEFKNAYAKDASVSPALIMNLSAATPFWSVMNITDGEVQFETLWDQQVSSLTALQALAGKVADGYRVMVTANSSTANMWTLWSWSDANTKFELIANQRYNTSDIFTVIDWYATGYDSTLVPSTIFATQAARQVGLGENPIIQYVKILDDGQGRWMWQKFDGSVWQTVAKENGTVQFSDNIWANTGNTFDVLGTLPSNFATQAASRDMGYELTVMLNILRESVFIAAEQNELFFSMIKYLHTEQDFVDWCFKTSFMYVQGFNANLIASPIASIDYTSDLLSYIDEVKPYHVKIRNFIRKYGVNDTVNAHVTDFDKPVYFDTAKGVYRILDATNPADIGIMSINPVYKDWYNNWQANNSAQVRKIKATLTFDRVSIDYTNTNGGAINRLSQYWAGDSTSQTSLSTVMKGAIFNGPVISGGNLAAPTLNPMTLTYADSNGRLLATNAPSYVYFAQKFNTTDHLLPRPTDTANDNQPNYVWDQMTDPATQTWDALNQRVWDKLVAGGTTGAIYNAYEFIFTATPDQLDVNNGHRIEVYRNGSRLSLINGDYVVIADATVPNQWKVYFKISDLAGSDTVVIMLVAADQYDEIINAGTFAADTAYQEIINGSIFEDPYHAANHPEELVSVLVTAGVRIKIAQRWTPGSASITAFESPLDMHLPVAPQTKKAIALYDHGVRVAQADYAYDARNTTVTYNGSSTDFVFLDSVLFGFGGVSQITEADYFNGDGATATFTLGVGAFAADLFVTVDGFLNTNWTVVGSALTFTTAPANGAFIKVVIMPSINGVNGFNTVLVNEIDMTTLGSETFDLALGLAQDPDPIQSIIEVDGLRVLSTGIYEAFITPDNAVLTMGDGVQYANLTGKFNDAPIVIGTDVQKQLIVPQNGRAVYMGSNWAASDILATINGAVLPIATIVGTAPGYSLANLNPAAPELNDLIMVDWDEDLWEGESLWDDPAQYRKYVIDTIVPDTQLQLIAYKGYLISLKALPSDIVVEVSFGNTIPNDLTGYTWTPANADAIMMGNEIMMLGGVTGDLYVFDSAQADFNFRDSIKSQFPSAKRLTITQFANPDVMDIHTVSYDHISDNWFPIPSQGRWPTPGSLWVHLNGRKLREGAEFYVTSADNGWDVPQWDFDARDELSEFGQGSFAVRMNEENGIVANPGDHVIITVFSATQAQTPFDQVLYLDPLRDYGFKDTLKSLSSFDHYELATAMDITSEDVILTRVATDGMPNIDWFVSDRSLENPGVMVLGVELVRFLTAEVDDVANTITLKNVERGYRGTSIVEHVSNIEVLDITGSQSYLEPIAPPPP